jgi:hypothetical protein
MGAVRFKELLSGSAEGMYVCEPREYYQRLTNLPSGWTRVRLGVFYSFTNTGEINGVPTNENLNRAGGTGDASTLPLFGLSNGINFPGEADNRFVGLAFSDIAAANVYVTPQVGRWSIAATNAGAPTEINTIQSSGVGGMVTPLSAVENNPFASLPTGYTGFAVGVALDMVVGSSSNRLTMGAAVYNNVSDVSDVALNALMMNVPAASNQTSVPGWWSGDSPVGCTHLYMRFPFWNNRLRIHNMRYMQVG